MPEDASLDDFLDAGGSEDDSDGGEHADPTDGAADAGDADDATGEAADDDRVPPAEVDPAESTYAWGGAGAECEDCGAVVDRRWRDEEALVCAECKAW